MLSTVLVGQVRWKKIGCHDTEQLQNITVYRLSQMAEPGSSLPARHPAVNLVGNQNKGEGRDFPFVASSPLMFVFQRHF